MKERRNNKEMKMEIEMKWENQIERKIGIYYWDCVFIEKWINLNFVGMNLIKKFKIFKNK